MPIVALAGSSRSANSLLHGLLLLRSVLEALLDDRVARAGRSCCAGLPPAALVRADFGDPAIRRAREQVAAARLVVIATPIYKASFSGLLKTFLDLLPQDALRGKTVLALGTGGSHAHLLALDYALKPVLAALGARHILDAVYAADAQFTPHALHGHVAHDDVVQRVERVLADAPIALRAPVDVPSIALAAQTSTNNDPEEPP